MVFGIIATIIAVASAAASYVQQKKAKKAAAKQAQELASVQIAGHDSNRSLYTIYGETLVGSTTVWKKVSDKRIGWSASGFDIFSQASGTELTQTNDTDSNRFLYRVVALGAGPIEGVTNIIIDGESYNSSRFAQRDSRLHFASAVSDGPVAGRFFTPFNTYSEFANWNSAMTGKAVAYAVERLYLHKKSPAYQGEPSTQYVVKGRKVYDPRKDSTASQYDATLGVSTHRSNASATWQWSDNPSICLLDYLVNNEYGRGLDYSDIDLDSIASAADKCDEGVSVPARLTNDTGATIDLADPFTGQSYTININAVYDQYRPDQDVSNTQKRFRLNMAVDGANEVLDNVQSILNTFRGHLVYANGKYIVQMDDVESSSLSLNDDDIIGGLKISEGDRSQRMNRCTIKFNNKNKQYKTDQVSWPEIGTSEYTTYLAEDQDEKLHKTFTIEGCNDFYQAEDTAEFLVRDSRVTQTVRGKFGPRALGLVPGDVISLTYDSAGFSGKFFRVRSVGLDISTHEVSLELVEYDSSVYTWNANKGNEPLGISWVEEPFNLEPTAPTIGTITEGVITRADGSTTVTMAIPYTDVPDDADSLEVSYKVSSASVYQTVQVLEPEDQTSQTVVVDTDDATYDVRIRYFVTNNNGRTFPSAYATTTFDVSALSGTALESAGNNGVNTFRQASTSIPTAIAAGDIWFTTDTGKQYVATSAGDNEVTSGEWELVSVVADSVDNQGNLATQDSVDYTTGEVTNTPTSLTDINVGEFSSLQSITSIPLVIPAGNTQTVTQVGLDIHASGNESTATWSSQFYSKDASVGGCAVTFTIGSTTSRYMIGLNSDPTTDADYDGIDYAFYVQGTSGNYRIYESNNLVDTFGTITAGDVVTVSWDGTTIRYTLNGVVKRSVVPATQPTSLALDSSIDGIGSQHTTIIKNINFINIGATLPTLGTNVLAEDGSTLLADEDLRNSALDVSTTGSTISVTYGANTSTGVTLDASSNIDNALYYGAGATEFTGEIDATHNSILAAAASDPTGQAGEFYYNTTDKEWKYYDGSAWVAVSTFNTGALADKDAVDLGTAEVTGTLGTGNADAGLINTNVTLANNGSTLSLTGGNAATVTLDASIVDNALAYTGGGTYTGALNAEVNTINAGDSVTALSDALAYTGGGTYTGDLNADVTTDNDAIFPVLGLAHYWPTNAITSNTFPDVVGGTTATISGTTANATTTTASPSGKAYQQTGTNVGATLLSDSDADALETTAGFAWSFWFRSDTSTGDSGARILTRDASDGYALTIDQSASSQSLVFYGEAGTESVGSVSVGEWHHVAFSSSSFSTSNTPNSTFSIYLDGELVGTENYTPVVSSRPVVIGCNTESSINTASSQFVGAITEIRAYNRSLTAREIRGLYTIVSLQPQDVGYLSTLDEVDWGTDIGSIPANLSGLTGTEGILNTGIDLSLTGGTLSLTGAGSATASFTNSTVGLGNVQNVDTTDASNISTGTLPDARIQSSGVTQHEANITIGNIPDSLAYSGGGTYTGDLAATAGATWGTNISNRPPELTDGRVSTAINGAGAITYTGSEWIINQSLSDNMVQISWFDDSLNKGSWSHGSVVELANETGTPTIPGWDYALAQTARDSYENGNLIPVTAGETIHFSCWMNTSNANFEYRLGYRQAINGVAQSSWHLSNAKLASGNDWTFVTGSLVVVANTTEIIPFLQLNGTSGFGTAYVQKIRISRSADLAEVNTVNAGDNVSVFADYLAYSGGGTYAGDLAATAGATWGTDVDNLPTNLSSLTGTEGIENSAIDLDISGTTFGLSGAGSTTYTLDQSNVGLTGVENYATISTASNAINKDPFFTNRAVWSLNSDFTYTTTTTSPAAGNTILQGTRASGGDTSFFSELMPLDPSKPYKITVWARQTAGNRLNYLTVRFIDVNGTDIGTSGNATGWPSSGTYWYWGVINNVFPSAWTRYELHFGGSHGPIIPTSARYIRIGALVLRSSGVTSPTTSTIEFAQYTIEEAQTDITVIPNALQRTGGGTYTGDLAATAGATWGTDVGSIPANLSGLAGTEEIQNANIDYASDGSGTLPAAQGGTGITDFSTGAYANANIDYANDGSGVLPAANTEATVGADWNDNITGQPYDIQLKTEKVIEAFDYPTSATISDTPWVNYSGSGEFEIVQSNAVSGGKVLRVGNNSGNDQLWLISSTQIPYDPSRMYRITVRARKTAGSGVAYLGFAGVAADGSTLVNVEGNATNSSQHYITASGVNIPSSWTTYTGFVSGHAATGTTGNSSTFDSPYQAHTNVRYIRPLILVNYEFVAGTTEIDNFILEDIGANPAATVGATWGTDVGSIPANLSGLAGTEGIQNSLVNLSISGQTFGLSGAGTTSYTVNQGNVGLSGVTNNADQTSANTAAAIAGQAASATTDTTNAGNISTGSLPDGRYSASGIAQYAPLGGALNKNPFFEHADVEWPAAGNPGNGVDISYITESSSPSGNNTVFYYQDNSAGDNEFFTGRIPIDPEQVYTITVWARQLAGNKRNYISCWFQNSVGTRLSGSSYSTGWPAAGTYHYWGVANDVFPSAWTKYEISIGGPNRAQIPATATTVRLGMLALRSTGVTSPTASSLQLAEYSIREGNPKAMAESYTVGGVTTIAAPRDGTYSNNGNATGAVVISLPYNVSTMIRFEVDIYNYVTNESITYRIGGHTAGNPGKWYNVSASNPYGNLYHKVRFGRNPSNTGYAVQIGETNTSWAYPQIRVRNVTVGYANFEAKYWSERWFVTLETSNILDGNGTTTDVVEIADTRGNANWQFVGGTGVPADYADVTSANTAAGITGQGTLATQNSVTVSQVPASTLNSNVTTYTLDRSPTAVWSALSSDSQVSGPTAPYDVTIQWRDGSGTSLSTTVIRMSYSASGTSISTTAHTTQSNGASATVSLNSTNTSSRKVTTVTKNSVTVTLESSVINGISWTFSK